MDFLPIVGLLAASLAVAVYKLQFFIIYPSNFPEGSRTEVDTPDMYGMPYTEATVLTPDGENIKLYVVPSKQPSPLTVVFLGPNAGNMGNGLPMVAKVHAMGYNAVTLSYRGYGASTGTPSESGLKKDIISCLKYIDVNMPNTKVVLYGRSLGGAVAIYAATHPSIEVAGVILENTFTSIPEVTPNVLKFIPLSVAKCAITETWKSSRLITALKAPTLFQAGGSDELIPPSMFRRLYDLCPSELKVFKLYPKGMHNDTVIQPGYWDNFERFLRTLA